MRSVLALTASTPLVLESALLPLLPVSLFVELEVELAAAATPAPDPDTEEPREEEAAAVLTSPSKESVVVGVGLNVGDSPEERSAFDCAAPADEGEAGRVKEYVAEGLNTTREESVDLFSEV